MGAEALIRLGRADDVEPWLDGYIRELEEPPRPTDAITDQTWPEALGSTCGGSPTGNCTCATSWPTSPGAQVLIRWWPRLTPGLAAAATHGIIRTSHAARSLAADQTERAGRRTCPGHGVLGRVAT